MSRSRSLLIFVVLSLSTRAHAQQSSASCAYDACAVRIAPRWDGLATVSGSGEQLANLKFLFPRSIRSGFAAGGDSALVYADRAYGMRRTAAVFTDLGIVLVGTAAVRAAIDGQIRRDNAILAGVGAGSFAISVPLQFAADDLLGKAVWWYNRRFAH